MHKITVVTLVLLLVLGLWFFLLRQSKEVKNDTDSSDSKRLSFTQNVETRDGVQYVTINVRGGYSPRASTAKAGVPTKLIMKTNGTYDCSASLVIRSIGYQKVLPQTGEEIIDLGTPKPETLQGVCSMGMYSFAVNFK